MQVRYPCIRPEAGPFIARRAYPPQGGPGHPETGLQGYLGHKKPPPQGLRHRPTVGS